MKKVQIALVTGDGAAPEMVREAQRLMLVAGALDDIETVFVPTPMGWNAYQEFGDTTPEESIRRAKEIGLVFFGGVGDPKFDKTIGVEKPEMMPEARALLRLRQEMGLLLNFRPAVFRPSLRHLSPLKSELIPDAGVEQYFIRFLLEDSYFGNQDFRKRPQAVWNVSTAFANFVSNRLNILLRHEVTGNEPFVTNLAYYRKETLEKFFRAVFTYARSKNLPFILVDKANVLPNYAYYRKVAERIAPEFPDVPFRCQLVDSANELLFDPAKLQGVIACGNEHGDVLSDGAMKAVGGLGLMHSGSTNPDTGEAMFESGAGTAVAHAGRDTANPIGRILAGALLLRHIGALKGAAALEKSVWTVLEKGYRTGDIAEPGCQLIIRCSQMGDLVHKHLVAQAAA